MSGISGRTPVQTNAGTVSPKILAQYDRMLLLRVTVNDIFGAYAQARTIAKNGNTKKGFARRYKNLQPATTPLAEYDGSNIKGPNKIVNVEIEYAINHYGDYVTYTDEEDLYNLDNIKTIYMDLLGDQAQLTAEVIRRDTLRGGTNVVYADGQTSRADVATNKKIMTMSDFTIIKLKLQRQLARKHTELIKGSVNIGTSPIDACWVAVASGEVIEDWKKLAGWKHLHEYAAGLKSKPLENEVGAIDEFRVVRHDFNSPIPDQGTGSDTNVYISYFIAKDAYATISLRGEGGIKSKVKAIGSAGTEDPLDQYGTIGWKMITGCAILNQAWIIRAESVVTLEDDTPLDYMDNT